MTTDYGNSWSAVETTLTAGSNSTGIFSLAAQNNHVVAVGGDFLLPGHGGKGAVSVSKDGGHTWYEPNTPTYGYR